MKFNNSIKSFAVSTFAFVMLFGFGLTIGADAQQSDRGRFGQDSYNQNGRYDQNRDGYGRYNNDDDRVRWEKDRTRQFAYFLGYHTAYSEGRDATERGFRGSFRDSQGYRNDTNGFMTWMGYQSDYRDRYRRGYEDGFKDAQSRRARRYDRDDVERVLGANIKDVYGNGRDDDRWDRNRDRGGRGRDDRDGRYNNDGRYNDRDYRNLAQQNGYQDGLRSGQEDRRYNRRSDYRNTNEYRNGSGGFRGEYGDRNSYQQEYRDAFRRGYEEGYRNTNGNSRWPRN
jgi:hypothetical protein